MKKRLIYLFALTMCFAVIGLMNSNTSFGDVTYYIPYLYGGTATTIATNCVVSNAGSVTSDNVTFSVRAYRGTTSISTDLTNIALSSLSTYSTVNISFSGTTIAENGTSVSTALSGVANDNKGWYTGQLNFARSGNTNTFECADFPFVCFQGNVSGSDKRALSGVLCKDGVTLTTADTYYSY